MTYYNWYLPFNCLLNIILLFQCKQFYQIQLELSRFLFSEAVFLQIYTKDQIRTVLLKIPVFTRTVTSRTFTIPSFSAILIINDGHNNSDILCFSCGHLWRVQSQVIKSLLPQFFSLRHPLTMFQLIPTTHSPAKPILNSFLTQLYSFIRYHKSAYSGQS